MHSFVNTSVFAIHLRRKSALNKFLSNTKKCNWLYTNLILIFFCYDSIYLFLLIFSCILKMQNLVLNHLIAKKTSGNGESSALAFLMVLFDFLFKSRRYRTKSQILLILCAYYEIRTGNILNFDLAVINIYRLRIY